MLFDRGMKELYPSRKINSCYFDTQNLALFQDSEEGVLPRKKVRIRWYEDDNKSNKEIKISSVEGRYKIVENFLNLNSLKKNYDLNLVDNEYGVLRPSLIVSYDREYYSLSGLRITFDNNIKYIRSIAPHANPNKLLIKLFEKKLNIEGEITNSFEKYPYTQTYDCSSNFAPITLFNYEEMINFK